MKEKPLKGFGLGLQWFEQKIYEAKPKRVHEQQDVKQTSKEMAVGKPNLMHVNQVHEYYNLYLYNIVVNFLHVSM